MNKELKIERQVQYINDLAQDVNTYGTALDGASKALRRAEVELEELVLLRDIRDGAVTLVHTQTGCPMTVKIIDTDNF